MRKAPFIRGPDNKPLRLYRGQCRVPKPGRFITRLGRATPSFTPVPEIASVFAATRAEWTGRPDYERYANVACYRMRASKVLDLRDLGTRTTLWHAIDSTGRWDFNPDPAPGMISWDQVSDIVMAFDDLRIPYEVDWDYSGPDSILVANDWEEILEIIGDLAEKNNAEELENLLNSNEMDTYAIVDNVQFVSKVRQLGFDAIVHMDTFEAGREFLERLTGRKPEEVAGLDIEDDCAFVTYRPLSDEQVIPYHWPLNKPWPPQNPEDISESVSLGQGS